MLSPENLLDEQLAFLVLVYGSLEILQLFIVGADSMQRHYLQVNLTVILLI